MAQPKSSPSVYFATYVLCSIIDVATASTSVSPGSCISSWDFKLDPCDNLFSDRFTCGFRCDLVDSATSRLTELSLDQAGYSGSLSSISENLPPEPSSFGLSRGVWIGAGEEAFAADDDAVLSRT
ncbi:hypothetical protein L3X38_024194 [Prunus dulcis]|uniref:Uncharacterized protein n=1 Tax=Prunus dulcis TaxID=3755 RepID=A0AAD4W059_PRUDU|nr:hypothetical protein L3X38_024194 [Prunus dulcis]